MSFEDQDGSTTPPMNGFEEVRSRWANTLLAASSFSVRCIVWDTLEKKLKNRNRVLQLTLPSHACVHRCLAVLLYQTAYLCPTLQVEVQLEDVSQSPFLFFFFLGGDRFASYMHHCRQLQNVLQDHMLRVCCRLCTRVRVGG